MMATSSGSNMDPDEAVKRLAAQFDLHDFWAVGRTLGIEDETLLRLQEDSSSSKTTVDRLMWTWMNQHNGEADFWVTLDILKHKLAGFKPESNADEVRSSSGGKTLKRQKLGAKRLGILVGLFFVSFIEVGSIRTLSLIFDDLTYQFDVSTSYLGAIYGILSGIYPSLSFLSIPLLRHFSVRQLTMMGGTVSSVSLILASFTQTVPQLTAALISFGAGYILIIIPTYSCLNDNFGDRYEIAAGFMTSGGSMGVMVMPWLFELLFSLYGWRGFVLLLGGCNAHCCMIGALLKPFDQGGSKARTAAAQNDDNYAGHPNPGFEQDSTDFEESTAAVVQSDQVFVTKKHEGHIDHVVDQAMCSRDEKTALDPPSCDAGNAPKCHIHLTETHSDEPLSLGNGVMKTSGKEEGELQFQIHSLENVASTSNSETGAFYEENQVRTRQRNYLRTILKSFGLHIFKERPSIILLCIQVYLFAVPYATWLLFTIPNAQAKGLTDFRSAQISIAGGVANFVGRFLSGFIFSKNIVRVEIWYMLANFVVSSALFVNFVADSFWFLTILAAVCGFMMGFNVPTIFVLLKLTTGNEHYKTGLSLISVCYGTAFPCAGYIAGRIYDSTQSYDTAFLIMGGIALAAGITITLPLWVSRVSAKFSKCAHVPA